MIPNPDFATLSGAWFPFRGPLPCTAPSTSRIPRGKRALVKRFIDLFVIAMVALAMVAVCPEAFA